MSEVQIRMEIAGQETEGMPQLQEATTRDETMTLALGWANNLKRLNVNSYD